MAIKVEFDTSKLINRLSKRLDGAQEAMNIQVLKDSNYFCPEDVGTLQMSGKIKNKNTIVWDTKYARKQYYNDDNKSKDKNPNASYKWFERAKSEYKKDWEQLANAEYNAGN
jgi:hypothetical protein